MKKKISIFCSLLLALQMMLSLAVVPVFADEELTSAVYEEPESPAVTYNMNVDWKFKKAADGSEYPLAKGTGSGANISPQKTERTFTMQIMMTAIGIRSVYRIR